MDQQDVSTNKGIKKISTGVFIDLFQVGVSFEICTEPKKPASMSSHSQAPQVTNTGAAGAATPTILVVQPNYTQPFSTLNQPFPLKLDRKNYVLWKTMVSTVIRGHRLEGFVNGTRPCPAEFIPTPATAEGEPGFGVTINPEYEYWIVSDQLLMGWLYSSMTEGITTEVMGCDSSAALWKALENLYGAHLKSKMDDTQTLIQTTQWVGMLQEYLMVLRLGAHGEML
ncbi:hypothetical protein F8388_014534 [Cannabis sativa]|uniref:Retrotransposon Copia-like N-terminal domain-containing protein n=1 Tax=Cannabis sativa TaxID=3483 RepID=A0A7J6FYZ1_CANSA|nr:hypothetical protein F8388_014534 [Cannabis sativa]